MTFKKTSASFLIFLQFFFYLSPKALADDSTDPVFIYNQTYIPIPVSHPNNPGDIQDPTSTGAFTYSIPLSLPPGRNGLAPSLALQYSSGQNSAATWLGYGWSLSIPSIQRFNKKGMDTMYEENYFSSSLDGELEENSLSDTTHGTYKAKVEHGSFNSYTFETDGSWTVTDKSGTVYTFGTSSDSRVENPDDSTQVYQWYIEEIRDTNDNFISFTYSKDQNQIYPEKITYTGHGSTEGNFTISFSLTSRDDQTIEYSSGFEVRTYYLIDTITMSVDSTWVRKYDLDYSVTEGRDRELLSSITESAQTEDGTSTTTLPSTTFTYETTQGGWEKDSSWSIPLNFVENYGTTIPIDYGTRLIDVNGDGLADLVWATENSDGTISSAIYINTGTSWAIDSDYKMPVGFISYAGAQDLGVRVMDMNGDGLLDLVKAYGGSDSVADGVYLNKGSEKKWELDSSYHIPVSFSEKGDSLAYDSGIHICDVNGDSLPDLLSAPAAYTGTYSTSDSRVFLNTGAGWQLEADVSDYIIPIALFQQSSSRTAMDKGVVCDDVNNDGLDDLVQAYNGSSENGVYINQGTSKTWKKGTNYQVPMNLVENDRGFPRDSGGRLMDINGDGLSDFMASATSATGVYEDVYSVYLNTTDTIGWWSETSDYEIPVGFIQQPYLDDGVRFADVDGDGLVDILKSHDETDDGVYLNTGKVVDLLTGIKLSTGASISVTYESSAKQSNSNLPYVIQTPVTVEKDDGLGNTVTVNYSFENGSQYYASAFERKFAGFGKVTKTEEGRITTFYYHQGDEDDSSTGEFEDSEKKIGLLYQSTVSNSSTMSTLSKSITRYNVTSNFVYPTQTVQMLYTGASHVDAATSFSYNTDNGNLLTQTIWGEVTASDDGSFTDSTTGDSYTTTYTYASSSGSAVISAPSSVTLTDETGATVSNTKFYYDNLAYEKISKGNKTKTEKQIDSSSITTTTAVYNSYGLVTSTTDDNAHTTSFSYDSKKLYLTTVTNALGYKTTFTYDYSSGQKKVVTDPNGIKMTQKYDAFDRLTSASHADPESASKTVTVEKHVYDDTSTPRSQKVVRYFNTTTTGISYQYVDGWNRSVQTRTINENNSTYYAQDTSYNSLGLVKTQSLPYKSKGTVFTTATTDSTLLSTYDYDALGRKTSVTQVMGTITLDYGVRAGSEPAPTLRTITMTDTLGNEKEFVYDSYNRLTQVNEKNDAATYITSYAYNGLGKMTQLTDAAGNIQSFTYDGLGRLLTKTLPHKSTATTIDTSTFKYDGVGNVLQKTSPRSLTITTTYDALNRVITEDRLKDVTFTYDTCTYGIGRVCTAKVSGSVTSTYAYGPTGLVQTESRTIDGTKYTTSYNYDWLGNLTTLTYPDFSKTTTTYNRTGLPETITYTGVDETSTTVLESADYSPLHQIEKLEFGNGTTTNYDFDSSDFYRLKERSVTFGSENIQTTNYTYDAMLNITGLSETSDSYEDVASFFTYDDLYRLTEIDLTAGSASTTRSYTYNSIGNITSDSEVGTYTYNTRHPQAVKTAGSDSFTYNNSGSLSSDGTWTHSWNDVEQITKSVSTDTELKYYYDHAGSRVMKENITESDYLLTVNGTFDATPTEYRKHILLPVYGSIATVTTNILTNESEIIYHHNDHLGSHGVNTDEDGAIAEKIQYYPFGTVREEDSISYEDNYTFTGKMNDEETGLQYFGARYYFPAIARFISQDPWAGSPTNPQSFNKYTYGLNNPLRYNDPTGEVAWDTLQTAIWQNTKSVLYTGSSIVKQTLAIGFTAIALGSTPLIITTPASAISLSIAGMLEAGAISDLDQAFVNSTNSLNNYNRALHDQSAMNIMEQGPFRNMANHIPGMNDVLDFGAKQSEIITHIVTTGTSVITGGIKTVGIIINTVDNYVEYTTGEDTKTNIIDHYLEPTTTPSTSQQPQQQTPQAGLGGIRMQGLSQGIKGTNHHYQGTPPPIPSNLAKQKR